MRGESGCGSESVSSGEEGELQDMGEGRNSGNREMRGEQRNIFPRFLFMRGIKTFILFCVVSWEAALFSLHYFSFC